MFTAVRWAEVRLYRCTADRNHYVQLGDNALFKISAKVAESIKTKLHIAIKEADDLKAIQILANERSA